jgi:hypothetical protein
MSKGKNQYARTTGDALIQPLLQTGPDAAVPCFDDATLLFLILSYSDNMLLLVDKNLNLQLFNDAAARRAREYFDTPLKTGASLLNYSEPARHAYLKKIYAEVFNGASRESETQ